MNIFYFIYFLFDVVSINCMIKQLQSITFLHIEIIKSLSWYKFCKYIKNKWYNINIILDKTFNNANLILFF